MNARTLTKSQLEAIDSLPEHSQAATPTGESLNPARVYTDESHFQLELSRLLKRAPIPLTVSGTLPAPNMAYAHDGFGIPIVITRDRDGEVHAFLNACTHRGATVLNTTEPTQCGRMTCPYHAWSFDLRGSLVGVPRPEVFPTMDKSTLGLRRLSCKEAGGLIWVGLDPEAEIDFSTSTGQLADDMDAFGLADMHVYKRKTYDLAANWKLLIETFLETYHVPPVHKDTVAKHFAEVPTIMTYIDLHSRQTTGRRHFTRDGIELDVDEMHKTITHAYHLFPTAVLVTSPYHFNFVTVMPRAANRSIVECHMLTRKLPENDKEKAQFDRTFDFNMTTVFGNEDFHVAQLVQKGLSSGALKNVYYGGLEEALASLHKTVNSFLVDEE